ncbi:MAG: cell wall metabolism sensor histidine kinase WalK, partial [Clostridiales bacterium]|nr:cell wall metabolism sensor histidine kinase WalK [Clostridiales bacterium]
MKVGGITKRWLKNTLGIISVLLTIVTDASMFFLHSYYYRTVRYTLLSKDNDLVTTFFDVNSGTGKDAFTSGARKYVESFDDKDTMEVWVINNEGKVIVTSSGFEINSEIQMPDYEVALKSDIGRGDWLGKLDTGEKVMTMTSLLFGDNGETIGALRYMVSMNDIDAQLTFISIVICFFCLLSIALVVISGTYFIQSIVKPIQRISETAKQIAGGDYEARMESINNDDEICELSDTINFMAAEIADA